MTKPDLLLTQIKHCDYPLFRQWLKINRSFFGRIIVYFNENNRFPYLDHFMHSVLDSYKDIVFVDQVDMKWGEEDWRNISTNEMLKYSRSEWVCSIEQDWFSRDWKALFTMVNEAMMTHDMIGWDALAGDGGIYIHPAFWFIKRELLEKTNKDFAAHDSLDHFGWITRDAEKLQAKIFGLEKDGKLNCSVSPQAHSFHLGGVNQNYLNGLNPEHVFHRAEPFMIYNYWCREASVGKDPVPLSPKFVALSFAIEARLREQFPDLDLENNDWQPFFKPE